MKYCIALILLATLPLHAQNTSELERRNGFKSIHLGSAIDSVKGAILKKDIKEKDEFPAQLYDVSNTEYEKIGEVNVREVLIKTYKSMIYEIRVTTDKDPRVMTALEKSFGKGTYIVRTQLYKWFTPHISLTFQVHRNSIELVYRGHAVVQQMYTDKGKKVDDIAEGF